jgi:SAM-dependent methyltransferase
MAERLNLDAYFRQGGHALTMDKWHNYPKVYQRYFDPVVAAPRIGPLRMLEIGVQEGGSTAMWRAYLGPEALLTGMDIDPRCASNARENTKIYIGDQADAAFLEKVAAESGPFDIILDDGGHTMEQQNVTLDTLWKHLNPGGVFLVEDTHSSYWGGWGGSLRGSGTFIEKAKGLVDDMHVWRHTMSPDESILCRPPARAVDPPNPWASTLEGLHFHESVVVLEKALTPLAVPVRSVR